MKAGSIATTVCFFHCLLGPVLITLLPSMFSFMQNEWLEIGLLGIATILSLATLCWGYRKHHKWWIFLVLGAGVVLQIAHHNIWFTIFGTGCFFSSMIINRKLCKVCHSCHTCEDCKT